jgi:hypothetical protein
MKCSYREGHSVKVSPFRVQEVTGYRYIAPLFIKGTLATKVIGSTLTEDLEKPLVAKVKKEPRDDSGLSTLGSDTEEEMKETEVVFTGKSSKLDQLTLLCTLRFATNTKLKENEVKQAASYNLCSS